MSAEYSVEEVRNAARLLDGLSRRMLNDYAGLLERIEAGEGAVTYAVARKAYAALETEGDAIECMRKALIAVWPNPPAHAAQVDASVYGTREKEAVELAGILDGLHEGGYDLESLYVTDPADGDCFVARAADLLREFAAQPRAVPKEFIEDIQMAERLALKSKKLNRERMMGLAVVKHLSHLFAAAPSPGESA